MCVCLLFFIHIIHNVALPSTQSAGILVVLCYIQVKTFFIVYKDASQSFGYILNKNILNKQK